MNTFIRIAIVLLLAGGLAAAGSAYQSRDRRGIPRRRPRCRHPGHGQCSRRLPRTSGTTFPNSDTFSLYSELDKPGGSWAVQIGEANNPKPEAYGKFFRISGFELEYPKESSVKLRVTLDGTAPNVNATQNITVLRFQQLDRSGKVRADGEYSIIRRVVNPEDVAREPGPGTVLARDSPTRRSTSGPQGARTRPMPRGSTPRRTGC